MQKFLISPRGLTRIFQGEISAQLTRKGKTHHYRMIGFRHVSDEVMHREGYSLKVDAMSCPDNQGVFVATWVLRNGRKLRQPFFPREWSRGELLTAIAEAYETREPVQWETPGKFFQGRTRAGLRIVLELDDDDFVVDAVPRTSRTNFERLARWRVEHGFAKHKRYFCQTCGKLKRGHVLCHHMPRRTLYKRVRYHARKLGYSLWRLATTQGS